MTRFRNFSLIAACVIVFILFAWLLAVPNSALESAIRDSISDNNTRVSVSIDGLRKGLFFSLYIDSLSLEVDNTTALVVRHISSRINPFYLLKKQLAFSLTGFIGNGNLKGRFRLPDNGTLKIENAEVSSIPYLETAGFKGTGLISADLDLKGNVLDVTFNIPDADIQGTVQGVPLPISSFRKIQGALFLEQNTINITSISLDGERGYARLKGDITNGAMNLELELMPAYDELSPLELALISKYQISPGYYVIPIEGRLL